jgi:hypothetical protein
MFQGKTALAAKLYASRPKQPNEATIIINQIAINNEFEGFGERVDSAVKDSHPGLYPTFRVSSKEQA